jgi:hypothetical protein
MRAVRTLDHLEKSGAPKFLRRCTLPLTGAAVVDLLITNLAVFGIERDKGATLRSQAAHLYCVRSLRSASVSIAPASVACEVMRIAKPLLLVTTPVGVLWGLFEAYRLAGGLVLLMAAMMGVVGAGIGTVVLTARREQAAARAARERA